MATTIDVILDRVRSLCVGTPFGFVEAVSSDDFVLDTRDEVFRVEARGGQVVSGTGYTEERTDALAVEVRRLVNADYPATRRALLRDANSLVAVIVRDGHVTSGAYTIPDEGRSQTILGARGSAALTLRLTVPANYDATV